MKMRRKTFIEIFIYFRNVAEKDVFYIKKKEKNGNIIHKLIII